MATYTGAILQMIEENPGISNSEIDWRLGLGGRNVEGLIWPYVQSGLILVEKLRIKGERKLHITFSAAGKLPNALGSAQRSSYTKWTDEDVKILISLYPDQSNLSIADRLGRAIGQIDAKASKLKLLKSDAYIARTTGGPIAWSARDLQTLHDRYPEEAVAKLAELLGRTEVQVMNKARKLGLRKSDAFWKKCGERLTLLGPIRHFVGEAYHER